MALHFYLENSCAFYRSGGVNFHVMFYICISRTNELFQLAIPRKYAKKAYRLKGGLRRWCDNWFSQTFPWIFFCSAHVVFGYPWPGTLVFYPFASGFTFRFLWAPADSFFYVRKRVIMGIKQICPVKSIQFTVDVIVSCKARENFFQLWTKSARASKGRLFLMHDLSFVRNT